MTSRFKLFKALLFAIRDIWRQYLDVKRSIDQTYKHLRKIEKGEKYGKAVKDSRNRGKRSSR